MSNYFGTAFAGGTAINNIEYTGPVYEGYSIEHGGAYSIEMECALEQVQITQLLSEVATIDHETEGRLSHVTESYDIESVLESATPVLESAAGNAIAKVKAFLMKLWGKVKAFFASLIRALDGMTKSTADFVKKYQKQIDGLKLYGFKYNMYKYTVDSSAIETAYNADVITELGLKKAIGALLTAGGSGSDRLDKIDAALDNARDNKDNILDKARGDLIGKGPLDASDFRDEVRKSFRNGEDETKEVDVNIQTIIKEVKETSKLTSKINKVQKDSDNFFKDQIKMIDDIEKAINKDNGFDKGGVKANYSAGTAPKAAAFASFISTGVSSQQAIVNSFISEWHAAVKERDSVYKKVIMKAFSYKADK